MEFTKTSDLAIWGLTGVFAGFALFDLAYGELPALPIAAGATLALLALVEVVLAAWVRSTIKSGRVTEPVLVARSLLLAKASAILGAFMLGAWLGALGSLIPRAANVEHARQDVPSALVSFVCAALLLGAALWLESSCRTPDPPENERGLRE